MTSILHSIRKRIVQRLSDVDVLVVPEVPLPRTKRPVSCLDDEDSIIPPSQLSLSLKSPFVRLARLSPNTIAAASDTCCSSPVTPGSAYPPILPVNGSGDSAHLASVRDGPSSPAAGSDVPASSPPDMLNMPTSPDSHPGGHAPCATALDCVASSPVASEPVDSSSSPPAHADPPLDLIV